MKKFNCALIIDDDSISTFSAEGVVRELNITEAVASAKNGQKGIEFIREYASRDNKSPELIMVDDVMPVMNGFEFLEEFSKLKLANRSKVIIISVSSSVKDEDVQRLKNLGVDYFIKKPISIEALSGIIQLHAV